ncbi:hypothetical protein E3E12_08215 [Formicincola oecophyllae]|uniref:Uncharacterized protein n=1 Tax=Formicincola oecophyllae TaxID=2558361 RepID=A0A4Y6U9M6_9PROT|nr:hypothetical protein [Formicincola oecophyllae]QDH14179.1 hypothetical protein E3E12_08215 [Formicincola oecophyllae]
MIDETMTAANAIPFAGPSHFCSATMARPSLGAWGVLAALAILAGLGGNAQAQGTSATAASCAVLLRNAQADDDGITKSWEQMKPSERKLLWPQLYKSATHELAREVPRQCPAEKHVSTAPADLLPKATALYSQLRDL